MSIKVYVFQNIFSEMKNILADIEGIGEHCHAFAYSSRSAASSMKSRNSTCAGESSFFLLTK